MLWPSFLVLVGVGEVVAAVRAWAILRDQSVFATLDGVLPVPFVADGQAAEEWYADQGRLTLFHLLLGALSLAVIPLQFVGSLRRRRPALHRQVGRTLMIIGVPVALSGLFLGGLSPFGGVTADAAIFCSESCSSSP